MIIRLLSLLAACGLAAAESAPIPPGPAVAPPAAAVAPAISFSVVDQDYGEEPAAPTAAQLGQPLSAVLAYDHVSISRRPGAEGDDLQLIARIRPQLAALVLAAPPAGFRRQDMYGEGSVNAMLMQGDGVVGFLSLSPAGNGLVALFKQDGMVMYYLDKSAP
jgi:hypothetical protein